MADCFMSYNSARKSYVDSGESLEEYRQRLINCLYPVHKALELVKKYKDEESVFCFADPPYINDTINGNVYYKGMLTNNQHERLARSLSRYKGRVMLCGYRGRSSHLYDRHLARAGFHCYKMMDTYAHSATTVPGEHKPKRTEYVWTNYVLPGLKEINMR